MSEYRFGFGTLKERLGMKNVRKVTNSHCVFFEFYCKFLMGSVAFSIETTIEFVTKRFMVLRKHSLLTEVIP